MLLSFCQNPYKQSSILIVINAQFCRDMLKLCLTAVGKLAFLVRCLDSQSCVLAILYKTVYTAGLTSHNLMHLSQITEASKRWLLFSELKHAHDSAIVF